MNRKRIFIVDDEPGMIEIATLLLEADHFVVSSASDPMTAIRKIRAHPPDLILLDVALPGKDGFEVCQEIRSDPKTRHIPVIMVSVRADESNVVAGLKLGADDYIIKPFRQQELLARVHAALRRQDSPITRLLTAGPFQMDFQRYKASLRDRPLDLSPKEFELLALFLRHPGQVLTRLSISEAIWGVDLSSSSRNIDTHVDRLRKKLGKDGTRLESLRGVGYRLDVD